VIWLSLVMPRSSARSAPGAETMSALRWLMARVRARPCADQDSEGFALPAPARVDEVFATLRFAGCADGVDGACPSLTPEAVAASGLVDAVMG